MTRVIPQEERDSELTVTLPVWMWSHIVYAVESKAESQSGVVGLEHVADIYRGTAVALRVALDVRPSEDLPYAR